MSNFPEVAELAFRAVKSEKDFQHARAEARLKKIESFCQAFNDVDPLGIFANSGDNFIYWKNIKRLMRELLLMENRFLDPDNNTGVITDQFVFFKEAVRRSFDAFDIASGNVGEFDLERITQDLIAKGKKLNISKKR